MTSQSSAARIEDGIMDMLVADSPQILEQVNWLARMQIAVRHTVNSVDAHDWPN